MSQKQDRKCSVLRETILRNEKAKNKLLFKFSNVFSYSDLSARQDDTEASTGLAGNLNFISSCASNLVNLSSLTLLYHQGEWRLE